MLKEQLPPETENLQPQSTDSKLGDRILIWCFLASILINLGFGLWLNYADIYGEKRQAAVNQVMHIRTYKPPIKRKPKPKPPKKIIPPKVVHLKVPPPKVIPHYTPHPPPPAPRAASVGHLSKSRTAIAVGPVSDTPVAVPQTPGNDTRQAAPPVAAPAPPPAVITPPTPPAPVVHAPPAPPYHAPPPPPPPHHPPGYVATATQEAGVTDVPSVDTAGLGLDPTTINGSCVISFKVTTTGRITDAHVKKSSGNSDYDQACLSALRQAHGVPGIQDHILYEEAGEQTFSAS